MKDTSPAKFEYSPDMGFRYQGGSGSLVLRMLSMTRPGARLSYEDVINFARTTDQYMAAVDGYGTGAPAHDPSRIFTDEDFKTNVPCYAYKFIGKEDYDEYTRRGAFLVSSLERYREMEKSGNVAGDRFEGTCFGVYASDDRELALAAISGFDSFIFSAARDLKEREAMSKFGDIVLQIELRPFAAALGRALGCKPKIDLVRYGDFKVHRGTFGKPLPPVDPASLSVDTVRRLARLVRLPSLLAKPLRFENEREVRIIFPQKRDVEACRPIEDTTFLRYVRRID